MFSACLAEALVIQGAFFKLTIAAKLTKIPNGLYRLDFNLGFTQTGTTANTIHNEQPVIAGD